jgi:hypothetical protein
MSSFHLWAKNKKTGEVHRYWALDDYFGNHIYGYAREGSTHVMHEDEFFQMYERVEKVILITAAEKD